MGMGNQPIGNLVHLMESKGIRIFSLSVDSLEVDAFSMWSDTKPIVFLNTQKSSERSRFDAAHELGHLVLHRHAMEDRKRAEDEANAFASAFLMPASSIYAFAPKAPTVEKILDAKQRWKVSSAALIYRMHHLKLISPWVYRTLYTEISKRGYRTAEPNSAPRETSQILEKVVSALRAEGISREYLAKGLSISERELNDLMFGLILTVMKGGGHSGNDSEVPSIPPKLQSIK